MPVLRPEEVTLAEVLGDAGYATAFFGKWDLGSARSGPRGQGFESSFPVGDRAVKSHIAPYRDFRLRQAPAGEYLTDRLTTDAIRWIRQQAGRRPFFLYLAHHAVHFPWQGKPELVAKYRAKAARLGPDAPQRNPVMGAMIESLDESLGRILETLDALGVADDTLVIFLSDNGAVTDVFDGAPLTSNHPLRGSKGTTLEGGLRVPLVVRWPGMARTGTRVDAPVSHVDILPTVVAASGVAPAPGRVIDGEDLRPLLAGVGASPDRAVFSHFPLHEFSSAVRQGRWKLIRYYGEGPGGAPRDELYDLDADPGESRDLASAQARHTSQLAGLLDEWLADTGALLPVPNPAHGGALRKADGPH